MYAGYIQNNSSKSCFEGLIFGYIYELLLQSWNDTHNLTHKTELMMSEEKHRSSAFINEFRLCVNLSQSGSYNWHITPSHGPLDISICHNGSARLPQPS